MKDWIPYNEIDFSDESLNMFSIDTRDFHCIANEKEWDGDLEKLLCSKYSKFFYKQDELKELLDRYYTESGGDCEWRFLSLSDNCGWQLKYIRIYKTKYGFLVCNTDSRALAKQFLSQSVDQRYLNAH